MTDVWTGSTGMTFVELNDRPGPVVVLAGSLGADRSMWSGLAETLSASWKVVLTEWPGHGEAPVRRSFTVDDLAEDVRDYLRSTGAQDVAYCGLSLGGAVGQVLLDRHPGLLDRVVLVAAGLTFASPEALVDRALSVTREGMGPLAEASLVRWFAPLGAGATEQARREHVAHLGSMEPLGYALNCLALAQFDGSSYDHRTRGRVLVVGGADDLAVPAQEVQRVADAVGAERCELLQGAGHLVNVDQPELFASLVQDFIGQTTPR